TPTPPALGVLLGDGAAIAASRTSGEAPPGRLPLAARNLREPPSGQLFALTLNAALGWRTPDVARGPYLIVSAAGCTSAVVAQPVALGLHPGHCALVQMVRTAARTFAGPGAPTFAVACSDPCDGGTQGTAGMFDSLPYRNDAAVVMRRLVRSLPVRRGVL